MKFLDLAGVQQFKDYNDSKYVVTEDVVDLTAGSLDFYTKDEIDEMLENFNPELTETDPVFTASAASGITSTDISNWNSKQDAISDLATIRSNAADGAAKVSNVQADWNATSGLAQILHKPTIPAEVTESTVSGWGFTKNAGTITGITMNGASKGTSGVINLGTVITSHQDISGKADKSAAIGSLSLSLDSTNYKITLSGTKVDGTTFTVSDVIDLPLESVVVNGSYNNTTKKVVLTLQNGNTVDFSVADLVSGLQSEITSTNKLSADLISDGTTNKTVTATEKSTWNGKQDAISDLATIRSNAEAGAAKVSNVQSDWNATSGLAQILNKPTIPADNIFIIPVTKSGTTYSTTVTKSEARAAIDANKLLFVRMIHNRMVMPLRSYNTDDYGDYYFYAISNSYIYTMNLVAGTEDGPLSCYYSEKTIPSAVTESTVSGWGFTKNTGTYSKPSDGIPATDLDSTVQASLDKADSAYQYPSGGIPKANLSSGVKVSLGKADTAIQSVKVNGTALTPDANNAVDVTVPTDSTVSGWGFAKTASPTFTGTPKAPTAAAGTNNTQIATTAFVKTAIDAIPSSGLNEAFVVFPMTCSSNEEVYLTSETVQQIIAANAAGKVVYADLTATVTEGTITYSSRYLLPLWYNDTSVLHFNDTIGYCEERQGGSSPTDRPSSYSMIGSLDINIHDAIGYVSQNRLDYIKDISVNGTTLTPDNYYTVNIAVPTESTVSGWGFTKNTGTYSKPSGGIPKTDLAAAVQTSLGKADTALQSYTETDPVFTASAAAGITSSDITNWNNKVSNVQSDWNATTGAAVILNKPTIPNDSGLVHTTGNETIGGTKTITGTLSFGGSEGGTNSKIVLDEDSEVNMYFATMNLTNSSINTIASDWSNIVRKATVNGTATTLQQDLDAKQNAITSTNKLDYSLLTNTPTIPAAPGTLKTNNTTAQTASASEALSGTINLHKVAKTGTYSDLIGTPTIPTESTVSGWGFTKNSGTVTGVKMNGTTKTPTSGTVDLGTVITSETSLSKGTTTGSGNAVTDISVSGHQITLTKGSTFLTSETQLSKGTTSGSGNVVTDLSVSGHTITLTKGSNVPVATSANAGKIPMITSSGGWEYVTPSAIYSGSATPNNNTGNNGDIYLQTS